MGDRRACGQEFDLVGATGRVSSGVLTSTVMAAVVVFFVTLVLSSQSHLPNEVHPDAPLLLLFASAFGFLYGTLIYANADDTIRTGCEQTFDRQMHAANVISESFGVYGLFVAIPLALVTVTGEWPVRLGVSVLSILGLLTYGVSKYSLLRQYLDSHELKVSLAWLTTIVVIALGASDFVLMTSHTSAWIQASVAAFYLLLTAVVAIFGLRKPPVHATSLCVQCPRSKARAVTVAHPNKSTGPSF